MALADVVSRFSGVQWNPVRSAAFFACPVCGQRALASIVDGRTKLQCGGGCSPDRILAAVQPQNDGHKADLKPPSAQPVQSPPERRSVAPTKNGKPPDTLPAVSDPLRRVPPQDLAAEQSVLGAVLIDNHAIKAILEIVGPGDFYRETHREIYRAMLALAQDEAPIDAITMTDALRTRGKLEAVGGPAYIAELAAVVPTASNIAHYAKIVRDKARLREIASAATEIATTAYDSSVDASELLALVQKRFNAPSLAAETADTEVMLFEEHATAMTENAVYLRRRAVIERLAYTESTSLLVGPKHGGKTTNVRTVALSVMRGLPVWDRQTEHGHVIYVASEDEVASTRMELLRMGWNADTDPFVLARVNPASAMDRPDQVLEEIRRTATRNHTVLIILDMLFDFADVRDEMSYVGTRRAVRAIQRLADQTTAHVMATHHSPKYMLDTAVAATAALGSQGIAARFSPIILSRKWADDLFTVESTMTRDPRGLAIPQMCIEVDENGWAKTAGEFKSWMKWKLYSRRIMGHMEAGEPGQNFTVGGVSKDLEIARPEVQNALYQLYKAGEIDRIKTGRAFKYFLKNAPMELAPPNEDWQ